MSNLQESSKKWKSKREGIEQKAWLDIMFYVNYLVVDLVH